MTVDVLLVNLDAVHQSGRGTKGGGPREGKDER